MKKYLIGGIGTFYKANLHVHTTISDGQWTPQQVKDEYVKKGYSIVAFTDHEVIVPHNELTDDNFLAITACEEYVNESIPNATFPFIKTYHFNFYAKNKNVTVNPCFCERKIWLKNSLPYVTDEMRKTDYVVFYNLQDVNKMIQRANELGFLVSYNHPVWSQQTYEDYSRIKGLWGVEIYNSACAYMGYTDTEQPYDDLLKNGNQILPIGADDTHESMHAFGGFTIIESEKLDYESVFKAMEIGNMYASNGPLIEEITFEKNKVCVRCSQVNQVLLRTERRWCSVVNGKNLTTVEFDLTEYFKANETITHNSPFYIRFVITDNNGKKAWTRAYFTDELFS